MANQKATVKPMKKLISAAWTGRSVNWDQLSRALLQYRSTPCRKHGLSPAQKLFGHPVQDTLPAHRRSFAPEWQRSSQETDSATTHTSKSSQATYDQHAHPLQVGNHVAVQNPTSKLWDIYRTITAAGLYRHYFIKTQSGHILVRNRQFIQKRSPLSIAGSSPVLPPNPPKSRPAPEPRRSARTSHRPLRSSEYPAWLFGSSVDASELGGEV